MNDEDQTMNEEEMTHEQAVIELAKNDPVAAVIAGKDHPLRTLAEQVMNESTNPTHHFERSPAEVKLGLSGRLVLRDVSAARQALLGRFYPSGGGERERARRLKQQQRAAVKKQTS